MAKDVSRRVYLCLFGKKLDPEYITAELGIKADTSCMRGVPIHGEKNKKTKTGYWLIESTEKKYKLEGQIKEGSVHLTV
jgi:hypothetical protein